MIILGAGLTGLICGAITPGSIIYEKQATLPFNHQAVLRFRTDYVSKLTGIPFKEVEVQKAIWSKGEERQPTPRITNLYSQKILNVISQRSIMDLNTSKRYIAPTNFTQQLRSRCNIIYNTLITYKEIQTIRKEFQRPIISTLPLPVNLFIFGIHYESNFTTNPIYIATMTLRNCNTYQTIYYPDHDTGIYRASLTKDRLIVESTEEITDLTEVFKSLGVEGHNVIEGSVEITKQDSGKINEIPNTERTELIYKLTEKEDVYSLGRYATWRPKLMLEDLINDIFVIRRLIEGGKYAAKVYKQQ